MTLIRADRLNVEFAGVSALHDVSMAISPGEIVTVIGPNGSGKSTLIKALLGAVPIASGRLARRPGLRLGYVPQSLAIEPSMPLTVRRFLSLPARPDAAEIDAALARTGVAALAGRQLHGLSGGQRQRVLLARALLARPDLLILDEPTQGLDQPGIGAFYRLIEEIRAETGAAILLVSHDLHVVMRATDRVICLNGHVCCEGAPEAVQSAPEYLSLFGDGARGALALYQHHHDHSHDHVPGHPPGHPPGHVHDRGAPCSTPS